MSLYGSCVHGSPTGSCPWCYQPSVPTGFMETTTMEEVLRKERDDALAKLAALQRDMDNKIELRACQISMGQTRAANALSDQLKASEKDVARLQGAFDDACENAEAWRDKAEAAEKEVARLTGALVSVAGGLAPGHRDLDGMIRDMWVCCDIARAALSPSPGEPTPEFRQHPLHRSGTLPATSEPAPAAARGHRYELWQGGIMVASVEAPTEEQAKREIFHYATVYVQDGPVEIRCLPSPPSAGLPKESQ